MGWDWERDLFNLHNLCNGTCGPGVIRQCRGEREQRARTDGPLHRRELGGLDRPEEGERVASGKVQLIDGRLVMGAVVVFQRLPWPSAGQRWNEEESLEGEVLSLRHGSCPQHVGDGTTPDVNGEDEAQLRAVARGESFRPRAVSQHRRALPLVAVGQAYDGFVYRHHVPHRHAEDAVDV